MKQTFFRIMELEGHQVLVSKDFNNEGEKNGDLVRIEFFIEGVKVSNTLGFSTIDKRDNAFEKISNDLAQAYVDNAISMFNQQ